MRPNSNSASPVIVSLRQHPWWPLKSMKDEDNRSVRCRTDLLNQSIEDCLNQLVEAIKRSLWVQPIRVHSSFHFFFQSHKCKGSMYGIYANIGGILMGSMLPYIAYMDPMGNAKKNKKIRAPRSLRIPGRSKPQIIDVDASTILALCPGSPRNAAPKTGSHQSRGRKTQCTVYI